MLNDTKYGWRERLSDTDRSYAINPDDFETKAEFQKALKKEPEEQAPKKRKHNENNHSLFGLWLVFYRWD